MHGDQDLLQQQVERSQSTQHICVWMGANMLPCGTKRVACSTALSAQGAPALLPKAGVCLTGPGYASAACLTDTCICKQ